MGTNDKTRHIPEETEKDARTPGRRIFKKRLGAQWCFSRAFLSKDIVQKDREHWISPAGSLDGTQDNRVWTYSQDEGLLARDELGFPSTGKNEIEIGLANVIQESLNLVSDNWGF